MQPDPIVVFYSGGVDRNGRTLREILGWNDSTLEAVHDYIQWVFPTRQPSGVNPSAPLVTAETVRAFAADATLRGALLDAFSRMLRFYGLRRLVREDGSVRVEIDDGRFADRAENWLRPDNHNHLRLTRIVQSLGTLGLAEDAKALQRCLVHDIGEGATADRVSAATVRFWRTAL
jgi:opioid growth factor receptor-like protein